MKIQMKIFAIATVLLAAVFANVAQADQTPKKQCTDVNMQDARGPDGKGRNLIAWECTSGPNQRASWMDRVGTRDNPANIVFNIEGKAFCITANSAEPAGGGKSGFNVVAWPDCSKLKKWFKEGNLVKYTVKDGREFCLDRDDSDRTGSGGQGSNIIIVPDCHGRENQKWNFPIKKSGESSQNPPQNQSNATDCNAYAKEAIAARQQETTLGCGFSGETWEASFDQHKNWCMANQSNGRPENDTKARSQLLDKCKSEKNATQASKANDGEVWVAFFSTDGGFTDQYFVRQRGEVLIEDFSRVDWQDNPGETMNDDLETVIVTNGTTLTLYEHAGFQGERIVLTCGRYELIGDPENSVSSAKIVPSPLARFCKDGSSDFEVRNWD